MTKPEFRQLLQKSPVIAFSSSNNTEILAVLGIINVILDALVGLKRQKATDSVPQTLILTLLLLSYTVQGTWTIYFNLNLMDKH